MRGISSSQKNGIFKSSKKANNFDYILQNYGLM